MPNDKKKFLDIWARLGSDDRSALLAFAQFLDTRAAESRSETAAVPLDIPRPADETVIAAIRRLSESYPMLNKDTMLHEVSGLVTQHMMQGRGAVEVIDELEVVFQRHYDTRSRSKDGDS